MSPRIPRSAMAVILAAGLAAMLELVDTSIVNVAIPTMMGNLGATLSEVGWVVTGYIIANAIMLPVAGWLSLRLGRRRYYIGCILVFTASSVACGMAPNLTLLVVFRILQGLAGGGLLPTSQALIQEALPPEQIGMASALYGMVVIIGPTIGPPLGGFLTDTAGWRSIFDINLPLGLLAAFMAFSFVKDHELSGEHRKSDVRGKPIDVTGLGLLALGVGALQFMLERGQTDDWFSSGAIQSCAVLAAIGILGFIAWELHTEHPIVNLRLFKVPNLRYGAVAMGLLGFTTYGIIFMVPVFCSGAMGLTATQTGIIFIPGALSAGLIMPFVGRVLRHRDPRQLLVVGVALVCACLMMLASCSPAAGEGNLFWPLLFRGLGMAFLFVPLNTAVLGSFSGPEVGGVAGITNLFRQLGGSLGIALISTLFTRRVDTVYADLAGRVSFLNPMLAFGQRRMRAPALDLGLGTPAQVAARFAWFRVQHQAFVIGFDHTMAVMALAFACFLAPLYFLKPLAYLKAVPDAH